MSKDKDNLVVLYTDPNVEGSLGGVARFAKENLSRKNPVAIFNGFMVRCGVPENKRNPMGSGLVPS